jgi:(p)ppGpp synthase/HD superfamily hydrolase
MTQRRQSESIARMPVPEALTAFLSDMPVARRAAAWAADAHDGQRRPADGADFLVHPLEVALLLHMAGYRDEVVAAGLLHDVVENTDVGTADIVAAFGPRVAAMVATLTEDASIAEHTERKAALRAAAEAADDEAVAVFAADKVVKARELHLAAVAGTMPRREAADKRAHYVASLEVLERRLPGHPFTDALGFELAAHLVTPALAWLAAAPNAVPVP